jgi:hypothetical protein
MSFDSDVLEVWLDELTADPEPVQEVCEFHAERLTAPRGWTVSDRRAPRPNATGSLRFNSRFGTFPPGFPVTL